MALHDVDYVLDKLQSPIDEYDTEAITHVMACTSHFPGLFLRQSATAGTPSL